MDGVDLRANRENLTRPVDAVADLANGLASSELSESESVTCATFADLDDLGFLIESLSALISLR